MAEFGDALRGYAFATHKRDGFRCCYCGLDGTAPFSNWLASRGTTCCRRAIWSR